MAKKGKKNNIEIDLDGELRITIKNQLILDFILTLVFSILFYICLTVYNELFVVILQGVAENGNALSLVLALSPIILLIKIMITLARMVVCMENPKAKNKKIIK